MIKIVKLTRPNVDALKTAFAGNDKVTITNTTAAFNMPASEALALVETVMNGIGRGPIRQSLWAVRRKLSKAELQARNTVPLE